MIVFAASQLNRLAKRNSCLTLLAFPLMLSACLSTSNRQTLRADYVCSTAAQYQNQVVGDGHCVSLIKLCSGAPNTINWRPGAKVYGNSIQPGSIIATFKNGRYPSRTGYHAAIYIDQDERGIWVWDQWIGKPVHRRLIRWRTNNATASNSAQAYRLVKAK